MNAVAVAERMFDFGLAGLIAVTAGAVLTSREFLRAVVLFIILGLLMALAWVRLAAPDIALAEAAIGTGITGVLLMDAVRHLDPRAPGPAAGAASTNLPRRLAHGLLALALIGLTGGLLLSVIRLAPPDPAMARRVGEQMDYFDHPVSAVLLVFRGLDTMLELGVLVLALLGMLTVRGARGLAAVAMVPPHDPVLAGIVRVLVPLAVLVAGYFLWLGTFATGGAFQAGVVLGAAGVLLWLSGHRTLENAAPWVWSTFALAGFAVFLAVAFGTLLGSPWALAYPEPLRSALLQVMEIAATISIGATLTALFVGLHPRPETGPAARRP